MKNIVVIVSLFFYSYSLLNSKILDCDGNDKSKWNNCRGATVDGLTAYVGIFEEGLPHGKGTFTYSDGATYVGEFKNGKEHGVGIFRCWQHGSQYDGEFKDGKKHGIGTYTYPDGVVYTGGWAKGKRQGYGTLTYPGGKKLSGKFDKDKLVKKD